MSLMDSSAVVMTANDIGYNYTPALKSWIKRCADKLFATSNQQGFLPVTIEMDKKHPNGVQNTDYLRCLSITAEAMQILCTSSNLSTDSEDEFAPQAFPGFFFAPREDQSGFILKYDKDHHQKLKSKADLPLHVDLAKPLASVKHVHAKGVNYTQAPAAYLSLLKPSSKPGEYLDERKSWDTSLQGWANEDNQWNSMWSDIGQTLTPKHGAYNYSRRPPNEYQHPTQLRDAWYDTLKLSQEQRAFVSENLENDKQQSMHDIDALPPTLSLLKIYLHSSAEDTQRFIEFLFQLSKRSVTPGLHFMDEYLCRADGKWFQAFVKFYWRPNPYCNWTKYLANLEKIIAFTPEEFAWFEALSDDNGDLDQIVDGLVYFFAFFKNIEEKLALPPPPSALNIWGTSGDKLNAFRFNQLKGILDCLSLAQDPPLQLAWIGQLPQHLVRAKELLRSGYTVVHEAMRLQKSFLHDSDSLEQRFNMFDAAGNHVNKQSSQIKNSFHITPAELKAIDYVELQKPQPDPLEWETREQREYKIVSPDNPLYYRALFLRYCAANLNPENFKKAVEKWEALMEEKLDALPKPMQKNEDEKASTSPSPTAALGEKLKANWQTVRAFVLALPSKTSAVQEEPAWLNKMALLPKEYNAEKLQRILQKMGVAEEEQKTIINDITYLNSCAFTFPSADTEFRAAIDQAVQTFRALQDQPGQKQDEAMLECFALMREAHFRLSRKTDASGKLQQLGQWLRLEQVVAILLDYRQNGLFDIKTDEGKTLILQMTAMLQALQGKEVTVITHTQRLAKESCDQLKPLAGLFAINVLKKIGSEIDVDAKEGDSIIYTDISSAVINHVREQLADTKAEEGKGSEHQRKKIKVGKIDEADAVTLDIYADTTHEISTRVDEAADPNLEAFLMLLNKTVREDLIKEGNKTLSPDAQRAYIIAAIQKGKALPEAKHPEVKQNSAVSELALAYVYYQTHCENNPQVLDRWIHAAVTAATLKNGRQYQVQNNHVYIVHYEDAGNLDLISQWGKGVHPCVAAWEKYKGAKSIIIPALSQVIATGNIRGFLRSEFDEISGYTGTLGDPATRQAIETTVFKGGEVRTFALPPAERPPLTDANLPLRPVINMPTGSQTMASNEDQKKGPNLAEGKGEPASSSEEKKTEQKSTPTLEHFHKRLYKFPAEIYADTKEESGKKRQFKRLLEAVENIQNSETIQGQKQSATLFFSCIADCELMYKFLALNGIDPGTLQILDDIEAPPGTDPRLRPGEATVIKQAKNPGMITLCTAIGGRGLDFDGLNPIILTSPAMERVMQQAEERGGRHFKFTACYGIYWEGDLHQKEGTLSADAKSPAQTPPPSSLETPVADEKQPSITEDDRFLRWQKAKQVEQLQRIDNRQALDLFKEQQQKAVCELKRQTTDPEALAALDAQWRDYFTDLSWQDGGDTTSLQPFSFSRSKNSD